MPLADADLLPAFSALLRSQPPGGPVRRAGRAADADAEVPGLVQTARFASATRIEAGPIAGRKVAEREAGHSFTHFMDGIQRTWTACHDGLSPVVYAHLGAVVRARQDRRLFTWQERSAQGVYAPLALLSPAFRDAMARFPVHDTLPAGEPPAQFAHPAMLQEEARKRINARREELERELAEAWIREHRDRSEAWLLLDGALRGSRTISEAPRVVGVIKSHATQYFGPEDQAAILAMGRAERSAIFQPDVSFHTPVYSWYLRLRDPRGHEPFFGLIRVEMAPGEGTLALADRICAWLLAETAPLSLPDGRWDRMLYPIRDCEQYLKSRAPSFTAIDALLS